MWTPNTTYDGALIRRHTPAYEYKGDGVLVPMNDAARKLEAKCDHQCSSDCRRGGCNCKCGEFHEPEELDAMLISKDEKYV